VDKQTPKQLLATAKRDKIVRDVWIRTLDAMRTHFELEVESIQAAGGPAAAVTHQKVVTALTVAIEAINEAARPKDNVVLGQAEADEIVKLCKSVKETADKFDRFYRKIVTPFLSPTYPTAEQRETYFELTTVYEKMMETSKYSKEVLETMIAEDLNTITEKLEGKVDAE
jgi:hypothetical protein